ncbi:MAG: phage replisome organizer N-terminal domain-containing protein [Clostridia bacterium]|nr:phage replisome organizer N-terminal domain-containing protein [Clostridia bacterium]
MAEYNNSKFYWLKLKDDFFKRPDIKIIKSMKNGKDFVLFYIQLLLESISHEGYLRFSDSIPYSEDMLSALTDTDIDTVHLAMKTFIELDLIEILDDLTIFLKETQKIIGSSTISAEKKQEQIRKRVERKQQKRDDGGTKVEIFPPEIDIRDKEIKSLDNRVKNEENIHECITPPTVEEVKAYCIERNNNIDAQHFVDYNEARGWELKKGVKMKDWKATIRLWEQNEKDVKPKTKIDSGFDLDGFFEAAVRRRQDNYA